MTLFYEISLKILSFTFFLASHQNLYRKNFELPF